MARELEIAFVDPRVSDRETIFGSLRPGVEAIVLDPAKPAARADAPIAQPPLTAAGIANYAGVLAASEIMVVGTLPEGETTEVVRYFIVDTSRSTIVGQVVLPNATKQNNSVSMVIKVPSAAGAYAVGTFDSAGNFQPSTLLRVTSVSKG